MKRKKLSDLRVGVQVRTSPSAKRLDLGDIEMPTLDYVWRIMKNDGKQIVLRNEHESVELTFPRTTSVSTLSTMTLRVRTAYSSSTAKSG